MLKNEANPFRPTIAGELYMAIARSAFGDGDCQHTVKLRCKTAKSKKTAIVGHSDFTMVIAVCDEDKNLMQGPLTSQVQSLLTAYKEAGY